MPKKIMLTIMAACVTMCCIGCKNGNLKNESASTSHETLTDSGEIANAFSGEEIKAKEGNPPLDEEYIYNESGKIIIAMYHKFQDKETDEYTRSFENFKKDLEYLYEHNYRSVSLTDYLENKIKVPVGCTPIVFTFDDGTSGQFNLIKDEDGKLIANPKSAVGIMESFSKEHPDFGLNGTFYINQTSFFKGEGSPKERLEYLINKGFEIGNHTANHIYLNKATENQIIEEVGKVNNLIYELTGKKPNSLALPFGINSKEYADDIARGSYLGVDYENKIILLVGANPVYPSTSEKVNLQKLARVRARGGEKEVECDLYYWLEYMENNPKMKYERIK